MGFLSGLTTIVPLTIAVAASVAAQTVPPMTATGAFNVSPLRLEMSAGQEASMIELRNTLGRESAVQLRVFAWSQFDGIDRYALTDEFVISPSIVRMAPDALQLFHVVRQHSFTGSGERRYRIVIDQIPVRQDIAATGAMTRLQITVPLFVGSETASPASLSPHIAGGRLVMINSGGRTARISDLQLSAPGADWPVDLKPGRYILGGSQVTYPLASSFVCGAVQRLHLKGTIDRASYDAEPAQDCP